MVGKPNPKTNSPLVLEARRDSQRVLIRKMKECLAEKGLYAIDVLETSIEPYVKLHWPPNPQTVIEQHGLQATLPLSEETIRKLQPHLEGRQRLETCPRCHRTGRNE